MTEHRRAAVDTSVGRLAVAVLILAVAGCAARGIPATLEPEVARTAIAATAPEQPVRAVFEWSLRDDDARFSGDGVARIAPTYRVRLDLFGPRGEGYLSAALVGQELRLPPGAGEVPLPPPALMWAALGVVAPPDGAVLVATTVKEDRTELFYETGDGRLRYTLRTGRLQEVVWEGEQGRQDVELQGTGVVPDRAQFRDWRRYTELTLILEQVEEVDEYPPEIWDPGA